MAAARPLAALFAANTGGHLLELLALSDRLPLPPFAEALWVTFDEPQSRSLLAGREVLYVRHAGPRQAGPATVNALHAAALLGRRRFTHAFSTGSSIALSFLPLAALSGAEAHYIESATRLAGPSLTGRILQGTPGVRLSCQSELWAGRRWHYAGSVFDGFAAEPGPSQPFRRAVVTVGSLERFGFRRLVERLQQLLPPGTEVLWQTGATDVTGLGLSDARRAIPAHELQVALTEADVVMGHAGVGTALTAFSAGKLPVLVPREAVHGEHVDDHQAEIGAELQRRGLAVVRRVEELTLADLQAAAGGRVGRADDPEPIDLARGWSRRHR
ncbi:MAG: glycosyltransferase [Acidimicrobiales bacterium]